MRDKLHTQLERFRRDLPGYPSQNSGDLHGYFETPKGSAFPGLRIISSGDLDPSGWEHVSVSLQFRCPTWEEMCWVKSLFWRKDETVVQFHPKISRYKNEHPYCLHMWSRRGHEYELPPDDAV